MEKMYRIMKKKQKIIILGGAVLADFPEEQQTEIQSYVNCGYVIVPQKPKKEEPTPIPAEELTKDYNFDYDKILKADMINYADKFGSDEQKKNFAKKAYILKKDSKGNEVKVYRQINAKKAFFEIFFADKWIEIKKMLDERQFKNNANKKAKEKNDLLLSWMEL